MAKFSEVLRKLREEFGHTQEQLGKLVGVSKSSINMYERGEREPGFETLESFADLFNVDMDYLMGRQDVPKRQNLTIELLSKEAELLEKRQLIRISTQKIPIIGTIAAGKPILADEHLECFVEIGVDIKCDYGLRVKGDSMINARIYDGDIVFIRKQPDVHDGEIAAVLIEDEVTLKRVYKGHDYIKLVAENPKYLPIIVSEADSTNVLILGKATAFQGNII